MSDTDEPVDEDTALWDALRICYNRAAASGRNEWGYQLAKVGDGWIDELFGMLPKNEKDYDRLYGPDAPRMLRAKRIIEKRRGLTAARSGSAPG